MTSLAPEHNDGELDVAAGHHSGFVAVAGRPNVGKSTLINRLMRQKLAIVSPRPQTTRTRQLAIITEPGYQMILVDTPGIIGQTRHQLDEFMVASAVEAVRDADIVLWLVDGSFPPTGADEASARRLTDLVPARRVFLAINKSDLLAPAEVEPRTAAYRALIPEAEWILFSAQEGHGCQDLIDRLVEMLPEGPRYYPPDQVTDVFVRDIAAEMVREQIMRQLREELPYSAAVQVQQFKKRPDGTTYISADILVEKDSHKGILIGAKGRQLRAIGQEARLEIETLVGGKVFLDLHVKVESRWRQSASALRRLGYGRHS